MISEAIQRLEYLCTIIPALLEQIPEKEFALKHTAKGWSKKEIIGHLIDSAANNHHRFVRTQFENAPAIFYNADEWNEHNYYNALPAKQIISFWTSYNKQLTELLKHIPEKHLLRECNTGGNKNVTLAFIITDYVEHLEQHLKQVVNY